MQVFRYVDFGLSFASIAYGVYSKDLWWVAGGCLGLVIALWNPTRRVQGVLKTRLAAGRRVSEGSASYGVSDSDLAAELAVGSAVAQNDARLDFSRPMPEALPGMKATLAAHNLLLLHTKDQTRV